VGVGITETTPSWPDVQASVSSVVSCSTAWIRLSRRALRRLCHSSCLAGKAGAEGERRRHLPGGEEGSTLMQMSGGLRPAVLPKAGSRQSPGMVHMLIGNAPKRAGRLSAYERLRKRFADAPKSGRLGHVVYYMRGRKQCERGCVVPLDPRTPAQVRQRGDFSAIARAWGKLTEGERLAWNLAGQLELSRVRLGQCGPLTGQVFFQRINCSQAAVGKDWLLWPPDPVVFGSSPVEELIIRQEEGRTRLWLRLSGPSEYDLMVFGQAPCSAGRKKWRHGAQVGCLPAWADGEVEITEMYAGRYGEPEPGKRVLIRTRQQWNGWESASQDTSAVAPARIIEERRREAGKNGLRGCSRRLLGFRGLNESNDLNGLQGEREDDLPCTRERFRGGSVVLPWQHGNRTVRGTEAEGCGIWQLGGGGRRAKAHRRELWRGT
jgi:hypothetical protein